MDFTWAKLFQAGGLTLLILLVCSIVSFIIILERWFYFQARTENPLDLTEGLNERLAKGEYEAVRSELGAARGPASYVLAECLKHPEEARRDDSFFEEVKSRAIAEKQPEMERYLNIEATLGTVSPFIGLLGTVLGIIRSFQSLGGSSGGSQANMAGLNAGIAEALIATAAGLFVAIPATIAYNYFRKRVQSMTLNMEIAASR